MKDSIGAIPALAMVFTFIIIISGYLAFTINYSKAFKMKSRLIDLLQESENLQTENIDSVKGKVNDYAKTIGYSASNEFLQENCLDSEGWKQVPQNGWCYKVEKDTGSAVTTTYIRVKTFVSIDVPIINKVLPNIRFFQLEGSTKSTREIND